MGMIINPYLVQPSVPAFSFLLDTYSGAAAAYSAARRLSSTYTGALIRVRRSSDNTEQDIGYTAGNLLDEAALTSFVGANNGFVTTWYDQSGNGKNSIQTSAVNQPQIVTSGIVETKNGKPNIKFIYDQLTIGTQVVLQTPGYITFVGGNTSNTESIYAGFVNYYSGGSTSDNPEIRLGNSIGSGASINWGGNVVSFTGTFDFLTNRIHTLTTTSDITMTYYGNNTQLAIGTRSGTWSNTVNSVGFTLGGSFWGNRECDFQEFIIYNNNQSSNRSSITANINTFYSIY